MKWLLRSVITIFVIFISCCGIGFFMPAKQVIETHIFLDSYAEDIYLELSDLQSYPAWFDGLRQARDSDILFSGPQSGTGQMLAWKLEEKDLQFGNLTLLQVQIDELVSLQYEKDAQISTLTYVLEAQNGFEILGQDNSAPQVSSASQISEGGSVLMLTRYERELGGFPYLSRVQAKLINRAIQAEFEQSMQNFKSYIETVEPF